ncbi:MAG: zinc ribbon domain-containing protein [Candidatus Aminicenantes bacterium]|nr:zinc ribbon domain-containing protein [Candidatus Aminicenantes bacterium]
MGFGSLNSGEMLIGLVLAALLGLIPANIAKKKGYSFGLWWLFGFLFFILALIIALVMKSKTAPGLQAVADVQATPPGMVKCPHCQSNIVPQAAVCPYCAEKTK